MLFADQCRSTILEEAGRRDALDDIAARLENPNHATAVCAVRELVQVTKSLRDGFDGTVWRNDLIPELRRHAVAELVYQDPFTDHARRKPRGYPGDALLLDYIYKNPSVRPHVTAASHCGRNIFKYTSDGAAPRAVRNRRAMIASEIDTVARHRPRAKILSVACGHVREVDVSTALQTGIVELKAVDHDSLTIARIRQEYAALSILPEVASVKDLLRSREEIGKYDFVYASGLYDYLDDRVAGRLLECLLTLCAPGGKVWIANFLPDITDAGYMEAFMEWFLIYRSTEAIANLLEAVPRELISSSRIFLETERNIAFLEVLRS